MKQGGVIEQKSNMLRWIPPGSPGLGGVEVKNEKHMRQDHLDASHQVFDELPHTQFYQQLYRLSLSRGISTVRSGNNVGDFSYIRRCPEANISSYKAADANDSITKFEYIFSCGLFDCVEESIDLGSTTLIYEHEGCWQVEDAMRLARGRCQTEDLT
ncbi:hypothetical protein IGI04_024301 [Brassica rapa subsp. trilocularis]|uniref:Uncharacterized protein n=1 Tax=Brassica rapa subsp. trilocularis TaxID=1813537 RepID=A0ABQ7M6B9_BRACM|nr:hypothetical protein IGI04_024301 [Brassica rapa subsp. trilocularis]